MLHILLLILKILGIIIAVILGILVLLVCIVLFVPIRYKVEASCDGTLSGVKAKTRVTWLLHLIKITASYEEKQLFWCIRIAWKHIQSEQESTQSVKEEVESYEKELEQLLEEDAEGISEESEKKQEKRLEVHGKSDQDLSEEIKKEPQISERITEEFQEDQKAVEEAETCFDEAREESDDGSKKKRKRIWQKIAGIYQKGVQKIKDIYRKIKCTIKGFCDKIKALLEKKEKICMFLTDEIHKKAFLKVKDEVFCLLRKLRPKRLEADIRFGFVDPYRTGQLLAGFSMLYPFVEDHVRVEPDFENQILEGNLHVAGKIRGSFFIKLLWSLIWSREVRMTYRDIKKFEL